ncbi:bone marrow proteoglycan-like [Diceros bicornis minor]|uniref:bone marrow proteoglycan-like n=1 Tax=Diceros bicornis minor TaxID=77932 RepID=UPI0026F1AA8D|nr:bone marrow proteoglycan-like [Diceros bicornis minor]
MRLPLLLALLFGAVSALHLRTETSNFENTLGEATLPQDGEMPKRVAIEAAVEGLMLPEEEEEGCSGSEDAPEEEGAVQSVSALGEVDKDFQCPKEEDTVKLVGIPGCKTCGLVLVKKARRFKEAQYTCRRCYRGNLVSIHNRHFNNRVWRSVRGINRAQVWIGGAVTRAGHCRRFYWMDGSAWNFWYWARGQPAAYGGHCVSMYTQGGRWRRSSCNRSLPFICYH